MSPPAALDRGPPPATLVTIKRIDRLTRSTFDEGTTLAELARSYAVGISTIRRATRAADLGLELRRPKAQNSHCS